MLVYTEDQFNILLQRANIYDKVGNYISLRRQHWKFKVTVIYLHTDRGLKKRWEVKHHFNCGLKYKSNYFSIELTKVITSKTQLHAVNARCKRVSQRSLNYCYAALTLLLYCNTLDAFQVFPDTVKEHWRETWCQFHKCFTHSLYLCRSQKRKKILMS